MINGKTAIKRIICVLTAMIVAACFVVPFSFADNEEEELKKVQEERDALSKEYTNGKARSNALSSQIKDLEKQIYSSQLEISYLEADINETKDQISETMANLGEKQEELNEQNEALNNRLRTMYKNGEIGMLSVLLGSSSISELMTNMDIIERIYDADAEVLSQLEVQFNQIEEERNELFDLKEKLEAQEAELQEKKDSLADSKAAVATKKAVVDSDNEVLAEQIDALNAEADALIAKILELQGTEDYVGGSMIWPSAASTYVSSPFGNRLHPILKIYKLHTGIDIAASGGTNILAANSGVVISAGWNSGYGYMVMIDHGGGIVTLYAHSSKLLVSKGDVVKRGQTIALVGSTGMSTGNHLHFEVRVNGVYQNPLNYVSSSVRK